MSKRAATSDTCQDVKRQRQSSPESNNETPNFDTLGQIPTMVTLTPWVSTEIPSSLPPIPKIFDQGLEDTVFRHPGISGSNPSYERLEWLGDAYLELMASSLIYQTFPTTPSGRCSQLREILVRNTTLAQYFREYGLESKAQLPPDLKKEVLHGRGKSKDKDIIKVQADMFEAYVAAAIVSDLKSGLANTESWLKSLWARTIKDHIMNNETRTKASGGAGFESQNGAASAISKTNFTSKEALRNEIGAKGILIRYEDMPGIGKDKDIGMPLYTVGVYLDGWGEMNKLLATGTALKKKEAAQKAAQRALENKKLLKPYKAKKIAFLEAAKAAEESSPTS